MVIAGYVSRLLREHLCAGAVDLAPRSDDFDGVVLFIDIADSTAMVDRFAAEGPDGAERLGGILNLYFGDVFALIDAHRGDTIRIEGDGVMALWREASGRESAALRAARAAIALREAFVDWRPEHGTRLRHRLLLGAGRLRATAYRSAVDRSFFVVAGEPLRAIAGITHAGEPNEIIVTDALVEPLQRGAVLDTTARGFRRLVALHASLEAAVAAAADGFDPVPLPMPAEALLSEFVPRVVADRVDSEHSAWLAEFRVLSLVYVHLAGLDVLAADAPAQLHAAIGAIHAAVRPLRLAVFELSVGDKGAIAVLACGLPPLAQENNAVRALEAARRIRAGLARIGVGSAIGVATGRAFCGDVGNASRREYHVTGPVMNYGARLMQAAGDAILADDATARAAAGHFTLSEPQSLAFKGRTEPMTVYRVDASERAASQTMRFEGALHGREDEAARLLARLDLPQAAGGIVAIEAEQGAGKSRLLAHVGAKAQGRNCAVVLAATSPIEGMTAYYALRPVVRQLLLRPGDPPLPPAALLRQRLVEALHGDALQAKAALIEDILPLGYVDKGFADEITGPARRSGLEDLLVRLAARRAAERPLVVLVDDLHWLDDPSAGLLHAVVKRVPRVLVALATRPLDTQAGPNLRQLLEAASPRVHLPPLGRESISRIVAEALGVRTIPQRLGDFVQARSEGLPFHAEQFALSLRDQGLLAIVGGQCRVLVSDLSAAAVVDNVRDVIVSRIDTLDATHQLAVRVASVIGRNFELDMLRAIYPFASDAPRLGPILEHLVDVGILEPALAAEGMAYAFGHILFQEVTYELLTFEKRLPLHRAIAEFIEQRHPTDLEPHFAALASHWERAGTPEKAIGYSEQAALAAVRRYANHDALNHVEKIERLARRMPSGLSRAQRAQLALIRGDACHELSRFKEAHQHLTACAALRGIAVPVTRMGLAIGIVREVGVQALHRMGIVRVVSDGARRDRERLAAHIFTRFAEHAYFTGDSLGLVHATLASLNRAERVSSVREIVEGFGGLAIGLGSSGFYGMADFYRRQSVARAEKDGGLHDQGFAHMLAAVSSFQTGKWRTAMQHCAQGADICQRIGDRFRYQTCRVIHAYTDLLLGRYASAEATLRAFGEDAESVENGPVRAWILVGRATLDMILGRAPTLALAKLATSRDESLHRAERLLCDGLEAAARLQAGEPDAALRAATAALDSMLDTVPTMGIALLSVAATAEVHLLVAQREPQAQGGMAASSRAVLARARSACRATRLYAIKTPICRPRELLLRGRLAMLLGRPGRARRRWRQALKAAERLEMPLEQALCHLALADALGTDAAGHRLRAQAILQQIGARPWFCDTGAALVAPTAAAGEVGNEVHAA